MNWKLDPATLGLTFLAISPGFGGPGSTDAVLSDARRKALTETMVIGISGAFVTKSYWPIVGPLIYLFADECWRQSRAGRSVSDIIVSEAYQ